MKITYRIQRFDPEKDKKPYFAEYEIDADPMDRVLDGLHAIKAQYDGALAFRRSCGHGVCGSDALIINGINRLACKVLVKTLGNKITVEPLKGFPVVKDLVVDMKKFFDRYKSVMPYLVNDAPVPAKERLQSPQERAKFDETTKCILCAACTTSCPVTWSGADYVGPAAIVNAHRFIFDSRDKAAKERLGILSETSGVFRCRTTFNCVDACPRDINVTNAIAEVKRAIMKGNR